jgi:peptidoglycan/LPS O-acetylase OafA/YrhL
MPALDGLRALSIALVLLGHVSGTRGFPDTHLSRYIGDYANLGVIVFFVISGYLITTLLLEELDRFGTISLRLFYARRALRLFPAFFLLVVFLLVVERIGWIRLNPGDLAAAFTYTVNFRTHSSWYIGHLWSLSVEEQFYLLWPMLLAIGGRRRAAKVAGAVLLISPLARIVAGRLGLPGAISPCVADSLACGCLLAICGDDLQRSAWYRRLSGSKYFLPACIAVICTCNWGRMFSIGSVVGVSIINVLLALVVHRCVTLPSKAAEFLSIRPLVWVGLLSYSLYLWQQFFLNQHSTWTICRFPLNALLAILAAAISYSCVERPLNDLRRKLRRKPPALCAHS